MRVSIGFEIETQSYSPVQENRPKKLSNPAYFYKIPLNTTTYVYPDEFTQSTPFARDVVNPYLEGVGRGVTNMTFSTNDGATYTIQSPIHRIFHNTEFVATFKEWTEVEDIVAYMYSSLIKAFSEVRTVLSEFGTPVEIQDKEFPYRFIFSHQRKPLVLLSRKQDLVNVNFIPQCTFGIPLRHAMTVFRRLAGEFADMTDMRRDQTMIEEIHSIIQNLFPEENEESIIKNYVFLCLYSFRTRGKRKASVLFNVRHLFRNIWKYCFTKRERDILIDLLEASSIDPAFVAYFKELHTVSTSKTPLVDQDMEKVGILPFSTKTQSFFFEFRGLMMIMKRKCKSGTLLMSRMESVLSGQKKEESH